MRPREGSEGPSKKNTPPSWPSLQAQAGPVSRTEPEPWWKPGWAHGVHA